MRISKENMKKNITIFFIGCMGYSIIEVAWRGFTHWTMTLTGGVCFLILYHMYLKYSSISLWKKCLIGTMTITLIEFMVGCVVNLWLGWNVWDYSALHFHILGQISLLYSALWFLACIPLVFFTAAIDQSISH